MFKWKFNSTLFTLTITLFLFLLSVTISSSQMIPGPPHEFYGTVKDTKGRSLPDGTEVKAIVDNETYTTKVKNGRYGFNGSYPPQESDPSPFYVEDPYFDNENKIIYFYVNNINTSQTAIFVNGGITRLDLVVDLGQYNNGASNGGGSSLPTIPLPQPPVADADGPYRGTVNKSIIFYGSNSYDPDGTIVNYTWDFGDNSTAYEMNPSHVYEREGNFTVKLTVKDDDNLTATATTMAYIFFDSDGDGWSDSEEEQYGTNSSDPYDFPSDNDGDYVPDEFDSDDDNDGLSDEEEMNLGSNSKDFSDVIRLSTEFGVFFFVDITGDKIPDVYYNKTTGTNTTLIKIGDNKYLVDIDGDGEPDYIYNHAKGTVEFYEKKKEENYRIIITYVILAIVIILIILFVFLLKKRRGESK